MQGSAFTARDGLVLLQMEPSICEVKWSEVDEYFERQHDTLLENNPCAPQEIGNILATVIKISKWKWLRLEKAGRPSRVREKLTMQASEWQGGLHRTAALLHSH
jgi:hypothetical protein